MSFNPNINNQIFQNTDHLIPFLANSETNNGIIPALNILTERNPNTSSPQPSKIVSSEHLNAPKKAYVNRTENKTTSQARRKLVFPENSADQQNFGIFFYKYNDESSKVRRIK